MQRLRRNIVAVLALLLLVNSASAQKKTNAVALVLPFCAKQILQYPGSGYEELGNLCREYYQGFLLAMDSFENAGVPVHVNVFDTENDSVLLAKLLKRDELKNADLIIGPVMSGGNRAISQFVKDKGIYHVSPLMTFSRTRIDDPLWVSCNPSLTAYGTYIFDYINRRKDSAANIIVVRDKSSLSQAVSEGLAPYGAGNGKNLTIRYVEYPSKNFDLIKLLATARPNHIIIPINAESSVNAIMRNIKDTNDGFDITCYGFPKWLEFRNTDHVVFERMKVHIATPYYVNYESDAVKHFVTRYRERFYCEPTESAFKGFDQALVLIRALAKDGRCFMPNLGTQSIPTLHTTFEFRCSEKSPAYQNIYLNLITLENLKQKKAN